MILLRNLSALLILIVLPFLGIAQGLDNLTQYTLDNGLTVILNEDHTRTEVFGYVVCKAGSKDDPADATGMAHYMEHLLFKGTEELGTTDWEKEKPHIDSIFVLYDKLGATQVEEERQEIQKLINEQSVLANEYAIPNELDKILKEIGGTRMNANTSMDRTVYYNTFPPNQMERWLEIYSHRFQDAVFRSFQAELEVVYEEKNRASDSFFRNLFETLLSNAYKNHPYGQQTGLGTMEHLKNPSLSKMKAFYERWYVPNNMALILCGDFDSKTVKPMIENAFGSWKSQEVPEHGEWEEKPFDGRELVDVRMSPIKLGLLGFRSVPEGHPDQFALEVCDALLANESGSGLLNELANDHELLEAQVIDLPFYDHGMKLVLVVPKIVGQSIEEAEQLVLTKLDSLKAGNFEDWRIEAVKKEKYRSHLESLESNDYRGIQFGEAFARGDDPAEIRSYSDKINAVTKDDVLRVANKYFGENYLALFSKMGSGKGEKIDKPGYEPVVSNTNAKSAFAQHLEEIGETPFEPSFIDFENDIQSAELAEGVKLYRCENPMNDIFSLDVRINAGTHEIPMLKYAMNLMDVAYTDDYSKQELKNEMAKIGATYYFSADESYTTMHIIGIESDLERALEITNGLLVNPQFDDKEKEVLIDYEKTDRKFEDAEPANVADAAVEWVKYGEKSEFLDRLTMKEIKKMEMSAISEALAQLRGYSVELHYVGKRPIEDVKEVFQSHLTFESGLKTPDLPVVKSVNTFDKNQVLFVHKKNAVQSQVHVLQNGEILTQHDIPATEAFNQYFGGGFSGLVLQEIREYRSLAYTAGARYSMPKRTDSPELFRAFIGTQADKTNDALSTYMDLLRNMPDKEDRIETIKKYLVFSAIADQPDFRGTIPYVLDKKRLGYQEPPSKLYQDDYKNLAYDDIRGFYEQHIQNQPAMVVVVGDKKKVDVKGLEAFGELKKVKMKKLYSK